MTQKKSQGSTGDASKNSSSTLQLSLYMKKKSASAVSECYETLPVRVDEKVVWLNENKPEFGSVKWLGRLGQDEDVIAGVEFDNPVGTGDGTYKGKRLFTAQKKHGGLIPIASLIKADDFYGRRHSDSEQNMRSADPPSRRVYSEMYSSSVPNTDFMHDLAYGEHYALQADSAGKVSTWTSIGRHSNGIGGRNIKREVAPSLSRHSSITSDSISTNISQLDAYHPELRTWSSSARNSSSERKSSVATQQSTGDAFGAGLAVSERFSSARIPDGGGSRRKGSAPSGDPMPLNNVVGSANLYEEPIGSQVAGRGSGIDDHRKECEEESLLPANFLDAPPYESGQGVLGREEELGIGSAVELRVGDGAVLHGVIRWLGHIPDMGEVKHVAGLEMESELVHATDGTLNGERLFSCPPRKAIFANMKLCRKDRRFMDSHRNGLENSSQQVIPGIIAPVSDLTEASLFGKYRGIQGHHNSCYLDATLFGMFAFTGVFDGVLYRPAMEGDIPGYTDVQRVLREEIVNPLRLNMYVAADRVMKLRTLLENLSSVTGLTSEEKDPEEFLNSLLSQILKAESFLKLNSGQEAFFYQLFVEKDERLFFPSVQQLFEQSFLSSNLKLKEVPSCLIIQMPRFGKAYKMYPRILPSPLLDVTDVIENSPRQCIICGKLAEFECKECYGQCGSGLESISFCPPCIEKAHSHKKRSSHQARHLLVPPQFTELQDHVTIPRLYMELFSVVCIQTSHYVAFVKCGSGPDAPWCFFDSMADRKGEQHGYNIPEMVHCPDLPEWLSEEGSRAFLEEKDDRKLREHARRLFCDAYMCMYRSCDVSMYK